MLEDENKKRINRVPNLEDLTRTQFVLLVLFVTFIVSIASSIVTFSLLRDAPTSVTRTINNVVERTIEKIVPITTIKEVPKIQVVAEEDQITKAIGVAYPALVRVVQKELPFDRGYAGFVATEDGMIITRATAVEDRSVEYEALFKNKTGLSVEVLAINTMYDFAVLKITDKPESEKISILSVSDTVPTLGETVIAVSPSYPSEEGASISEGSVHIGIISQVEVGKDGGAPLVRALFLEEKPLTGTVLINKKGELCGVYLYGGSVVAPVQIFNAIKNIPAKISVPVDNSSAIQ